MSEAQQEAAQENKTEKKEVSLRTILVTVPLFLIGLLFIGIGIAAGDFLLDAVGIGLGTAAATTIR